MKETLYVHRPLLNANELIDWANKQGFGSTLSPDDMHVTVAFSKTAFDWSGLKEQNNKVHVTGGSRDVDHLGEKGAIVLHFDSSELHDRWQQIVDEGASWDYEDYHPHVSVTYDGGDLDPADIEPYLGRLVFGPEIFRPFEEDWDKKITEVPAKAKKRGVSTSETAMPVKYSESITGEHIMNDSLASLLMKNIDLILEGFNIDEKGNLVETNKKKAAKSDNIFHEYFVKRMNQTFRQINENDPILSSPQNMHPMGTMHGMHGMGQPHDMGMGMPADGGMEGVGGDEHMGDMAMDDMHAGAMPQGQMHPSAMHPGEMQHAGPEMGGGMAHTMGGAGMGGMAESEEPGEFDWVFGENTDLEIDSLFNLTEEDDEEDAENDEDDEENLNEFMDQMGGGGGGGSGFLPTSGGMDHDAGANDFGGDMGGVDDMSMDHEMDDGMGGDEDMVTIHGTTDNGGDFEFSFEPNALGFGGDEEGGDGSDFLPHDGGEHEEPHHDQHGMGGEQEEDENPIGEAAGGFHNGKPGKGKRGPKTSRMSVVPANPATKHTAPFPSPMGNRQRKK